MIYVNIIHAHRVYYFPLLCLNRYGRTTDLDDMYPGEPDSPTWNSVFRAYSSWDTLLGYRGVRERDLPMVNVNTVMWIGIQSSWIGTGAPE